MTASPWHFGLGEIESRLSDLPDGGRFHYMLRHGTMKVGLYAPDAIDRQSPHRQDELYIVASGSGSFVKADERRAVVAQDVIFVEAGIQHRFDDVSDDFLTWVIFWGPDGGEATD